MLVDKHFSKTKILTIAKPSIQIVLNLFSKLRRRLLWVKSLITGFRIFCT